MSRRPFKFWLKLGRSYNCSSRPQATREATMKEHKKKFLEYKKVLKTKCDFAIAEAMKAYELFCCFIVGKAQML